MSVDRAADAIADLVDLDLHRHSHLELLTRAWKLRANITAYDGMYVALAEALSQFLGHDDTQILERSKRSMESLQGLVGSRGEQTAFAPCCWA